jgi:hypothetical protein
VLQYQIHAFDVISPFQGFLFSLGGLHDSIVTGIEVDGRSAQLVLQIEDLYSNFDGLPEYPGRAPATIILAGIDRFSMRLQMSIESQIQELHIHDFEVLKKTHLGELAEIKFWPEGDIQIEYATAIVDSAGKRIFPSNDFVSPGSGLQSA